METCRICGVKFEPKRNGKCCSHRCVGKFWETNNPNYRKEYYRKNKMRILEQTAKYSKTIKGKQVKRIANKKWALKNPEKAKDVYKKSSMKWKENNLEKYKKLHAKCNKEYRQTEIGRLNKLKANRRRRGIKNNIRELWTRKEWGAKLQETAGICPRCNRYTGISNLTLDHIYPISKAYEDYKKTGLRRIYSIDDIQPLCGSCNSKKNNKKIEKTGGNIKMTKFKDYVNQANEDISEAIDDTGKKVTVEDYIAYEISNLSDAVYKLTDMLRQKK